MRHAALPSLRSLRRLRPSSSRYPCLHRTCPPQAAASRCWYSSSNAPATESKPYYITTPIFYVNAAPHIGHVYTMVLADVFKRWQQLKGKSTYLGTGTDEHGIKIQTAAKKADMPEKEFCDENSDKFRLLAEYADINYDYFIRTTDADHKKAVEQFYLHLKHALPEGLGLYKAKHSGWYCVSDECFYQESQVHPTVHPQTGRKLMASIESGNEVEWVEEETWVFPLTKYKQQLLDFYDANPEWITPESKQLEVRSWVENNLEDLSVTRPVSRLSWGVKDPEDWTQTIYVWVDALINYLTMAGYGSAWHSPKDDTKIWPADMHIVGKDIIRFHAVYWPALLMALKLPLPKKILCHPHWTMSGRKMSKSIGNVVEPMVAMERWGPDPLRYFLVRSGRGGTYMKDMEYSNAHLEALYTKELQANIGNLFQRIARPSRNLWSVSEAVQAYRDGQLQLDAKVSKTGHVALHQNLLVAAGNFEVAMDVWNTSDAIDGLFFLLKEANRAMGEVKPWELAKACKDDPSNATRRQELNQAVFYIVEALRVAGILLQPIMPGKMSELLDDLGVAQERRTFQHAVLGADTDYGTPTTKEKTPQKRRDAAGTLFPPLSGVDAGQLGMKGKTREELIQQMERRKLDEWTLESP